MERRKFVIGAGALATGSAAAIGTGAFNTVEADRTISVNVAGDAAAFLSLVPSDQGEYQDQHNAEYVEQTGNTLEVQFNNDAGVNGEGLNDDAETRFFNLFEIQNQGSNDVYVWVDDDTIPDGVSINGWNDGEGGFGLASTQPEKLWDEPPVPTPEDHKVETGEQIDAVNIDVDTSDGGLTTGEYEITIVAERVGTFE